MNSHYTEIDECHTRKDSYHTVIIITKKLNIQGWPVIRKGRIISVHPQGHCREDKQYQYKWCICGCVRVCVCLLLFILSSFFFFFSFFLFMSVAAMSTYSLRSPQQVNKDRYGVGSSKPD